MRAPSGWHDVTIHNVSRRGMMLRSAAPPQRGTYIEIRKATMTVVGRAVWVRDSLFGVQTQDVVDLPQLIDAAALQRRVDLGLDQPPGRERRRTPRPAPADTAARSRRRAAMMQFGAIAIAATTAAAVAAGLLYQTLAAPFAVATAALTGGS
jgi:hypothetical protein